MDWKERLIRRATREIRAEYREAQDHIRVARSLALGFWGTRHAQVTRAGYREALVGLRQGRLEVAACGAGLGLEVLS